VVQGGKGRRGLPDSGEAGGGVGRGSGQDGGGVHLGSVGDRSLGGNVAGELSRRNRAAVAAGGANAGDARGREGCLGGRRGSRDTRGGVEVVGRQWSQAGGEAPHVPTMAERRRSSLERTQCARPANACYLNRRGTLVKKSPPPRTSRYVHGEAAA
jgi:hypothetical protein